VPSPCFFVAYADGGGRHAARLRVPGLHVNARCGITVGPADPALPFLLCDEPVCQRCLDLVRADQGVPLVLRPLEVVDGITTTERVDLWGAAGG